MLAYERVEERGNGGLMRLMLLRQQTMGDVIDYQ